LQSIYIYVEQLSYFTHTVTQKVSKTIRKCCNNISVNESQQEQLQIFRNQ